MRIRGYESIKPNLVLSNLGVGGSLDTFCFLEFWKSGEIREIWPQATIQPTIPEMHKHDSDQMHRSA